MGIENDAPAPSAEPAPAASVDTAPLPACTTRKRLPAPSLTMMVAPLAPQTQPLGPLKLAARPAPSTLITAPLPARVLTARVLRLTRLSRCRAWSGTHSASPLGLMPMAHGCSKAPALPALPLPATGPLVHTSARGSVSAPGAAQAAGQVHGVGGAAPPAQKNPAAHTAPLALVEPGAQPQPGAAAQGEHAEAVGSHAAAPKVPAGQGVAAAALAPQKLPRGQGAQVRARS